MLGCSSGWSANSPAAVRTPSQMAVSPVAARLSMPLRRRLGSVVKLTTMRGWVLESEGKKLYWDPKTEQIVDRPEDHKTVEVERNYFLTHQSRLDYKAIAEAGYPIGSGAIESTCRQYQCRLKRTGQFWTTAGDEALITLETMWRNQRWRLLFPHANSWDPQRN